MWQFTGIESIAAALIVLIVAAWLRG